MKRKKERKKERRKERKKERQTKKKPIKVLYTKKKDCNQGEKGKKEHMKKCRAGGNQGKGKNKRKNKRKSKRKRKDTKEKCEKGRKMVRKLLPVRMFPHLYRPESA